MGKSRVQWKRLAWNESRRFNDRETFETKWTETTRQVRKAFGDTKGFSISHQTYDYLLNKNLLHDKNGNVLPSAFERYISGEDIGSTRKERQKYLVLDRFNNFKDKFENYNISVITYRKVIDENTGKESRVYQEETLKVYDMFDMFEKGDILYEDLKNAVKEFKDTNEKYLGDGSK